MVSQSIKTLTVGATVLRSTEFSSVAVEELAVLSGNLLSSYSAIEMAPEPARR
jgi:hypothetical protein